MAIDMRTLFSVSVLSELLFAVLLTLLWDRRRNDRTLMYWSLSGAFMALGMLVVSLRGHIPDWISVAGGNGCMYGSLGLRLAGMRAFAGQPVRLWRCLLPSALLFGLFLFQEPLALGLDRRILITGVVGLGFGLRMMIDLSRAQRDEPLRMRRVVMAVIGLQTVNDTFRLLSGSLGGFTGNQFLQAGSSYSLLMLNVLASYGALHIACFMMLFERHENRLIRAATLDALTSLVNRVGFRQLAERQLQRSQRDRQPVSVLVMDLDHFKRVNDRYGHEAGDQVLQAFARSARASLRPTDLLSRPGGEEFWALLPGTDLAEAERIAQRVCDQFREVRVGSGDQTIASTVSLGVAQLQPAGGESIEAALARADQALYVAKRQGRDRVSAALAAA